MEKCKYVVIDTREAGSGIFLFPAFIRHDTFAIRYFGNNWFSDNKECRERLLSAGFVRRSSEGWHCTGRSDSLKLQFRPEDTSLLRRILPFD